MQTETTPNANLEPERHWIGISEYCRHVDAVLRRAASVEDSDTQIATIKAWSRAQRQR